ncbi:MAG: hypothetical protein M0R22_00570 [Dehalococcoidia bacterium]|jgi:hypothetical protein|nr:hypothetical protein [Dehalococcoidia bacterium]
MKRQLPKHNGETLTIVAHWKTLVVKKIKAGEYVACIKSSRHVRWGNSEQIREDIAHFEEHGTLPFSKGGMF